MEKLLNPKELGEVLGVPLGTIYRWNHRGGGPTPIRVGRHVRYRQADVQAWLDDRQVERPKTVRAGARVRVGHR